MKYIFANWKMYMNVLDSVSLAESLAQLSFPHNQVAIFPNHLAFCRCVEIFEKTSIKLGAQNVAWTPMGAYTGALSAEIYRSSGAEYALVGHSERRYIFGETDVDVRKKVEACIAAGITPVLCIGETREDKIAGTRTVRLQEQIKAVFEGLSLEGKKICIAYEPVWAITHGPSPDHCLPADVEDIHGFIRSEVGKYTDGVVPVLYGGSVNVQNISSYLDLPLVDGILVGNASTKKDFWDSISSL
jgi:triosephosphate isomerase